LKSRTVVGRSSFSLLLPFSSWPCGKGRCDVSEMTRKYAKARLGSRRVRLLPSLSSRGRDVSCSRAFRKNGAGSGFLVLFFSFFFFFPPPSCETRFDGSYFRFLGKGKEKASEPSPSLSLFLFPSFFLSPPRWSVCGSDTPFPQR